MPIILNAPIQGKNDVPSVAGSPVAVKSYTTAQINALTGQDPGTLVWDSDVLSHKSYNGTAWVQVSSDPTFAQVGAALAVASTDIDVNAQRIINLADPTTDQGAASALFVRRLVIRQARTAAVMNQASPPNGGGVYGGITVANDDLVLILSNGANLPTSGLWIVNTAGFWTRPSHFAIGFGAAGTTVYVRDGSGATSKKGITFVCVDIAGADIVDTNETVWAPIAFGGRSPSPGTVIYDDNSAGGGISTTNEGTDILSYGAPVISLRRSLGAAARITPSLDNSVLGHATPGGFFYNAWQRITARQYQTIHTQVTFSATPVFDVNAIYEGSTKEITLTANVTGWTAPAPGGPFDPHATMMRLIVKQDATGGRTFSGAPGNVKLRTGFAIGLGANERTVIHLVWDRFDSVWYQDVAEVTFT